MRYLRTAARRTRPGVPRARPGGGRGGHLAGRVASATARPRRRSRRRAPRARRTGPRTPTGGGSPRSTRTSKRPGGTTTPVVASSLSTTASSSSPSSRRPSGWPGATGRWAAPPRPRPQQRDPDPPLRAAGVISRTSPGARITPLPNRAHRDVLPLCARSTCTDRVAHPHAHHQGSVTITLRMVGEAGALPLGVASPRLRSQEFVVAVWVSRRR